MIFLDMDGVLMDFEGAMVARGVPADKPSFIHLPPKEWTPEQVALNDRYVAVMDSSDFWPSLQPLPDAHELWSFCRTYQPHILSAVPNKCKHHALVEFDKRASIWRNFDSTFPEERIHLCLRAEKKLWARKGHILVDDSHANCEEWHAAGGTAILHNNAKTTIDALKEVHEYV